MLPYRILSALLLATVSGLSLAADLPESTLATGDLIILRSTAEGFKPLLSGEKGDGGSLNFRAPARTKLKVTLDRSGKLYAVVKDLPCDLPSTVAPASGSDAKPTGVVSTLSKAGQLISTIAVADDDCKLRPIVVEGHSYEVESGTLEQFGFRRLGFIYGGLVIPYKYFRHDKSLEPGTTIGPFLGYRFGQTGWGVSIIGRYAVTDIKIKVKDGTELKERTFFALSRGIGVMFDITKSETPFRAGIMWGKDRVGSNNVDVYPHDGRTWVAAQLGWEFGR